MDACSNLTLLTVLACQLSECLTLDELAILGANLTVFGDMLAAIIVQQEILEKNKDNKYRNDRDNCI